MSHVNYAGHVVFGAALRDAGHVSFGVFKRVFWRVLVPSRSPMVVFVLAWIRRGGHVRVVIVSEHNEQENKAAEGGSALLNGAPLLLPGS